MNYHLFIIYTAIIPVIPPAIVLISIFSDKKYAENIIADRGTVKMNALALFGPSSTEARKYIDVPNDIAITERISRFDQNIQSK